MDLNDLELRWQNALRQTHPGVVVRKNTRVPVAPWDSPILNVYLVSDEQYPYFVDFRIDEIPALRDRENLPDVGLISFSVSQTRDHYPEIWAEAQAEKSAKALVNSSRKTPRARRSGAAKKVAAVH